MKFRAYCIVVIGDTIGVIHEIKKVSETEPRYIDGKGLFIATFISASSPSELKEFFKSDKRNFMVFDLNEENSGVNIINQEKHEGLFGFLKSTKALDDMTDRLLNDINLTSETSTNKTEWKQPASITRGEIKVKTKKITEKEINQMTKKEKDSLWNKIMDNGLQNLTEEDKNILQLLSK